MNYNDLLSTYKAPPPQKLSTSSLTYWMSIPYNQYAANVPVVNRYQKSWYCHKWIELGIKILNLLTDNGKRKTTEAAFTAAVGTAISEAQRAYS